jgi:RHS repeat-associated protein
VLERYAYDPWGQRRNPDDWTESDSRTGWLLNRGYTGHEHLDAFAIINMNGRVYDPLTGMFLSPDPQLQDPGNWLNYNRYGYCYNNPLVYSDPTGEWAVVDDLVAMGLGGLYNLGSNLLSGNVHSWGEVGGYFLTGMASGEATLYGGPQAGAAVMGLGNSITSQVSESGWKNIDWGQATFSTFTSVATSILGGEISNRISPYISKLLSDVSSRIVYNALNQGLTNGIAGFTIGTGMSLFTGNNLETSLNEGLNGGATGLGLGFMTGSIQGYKMQQEVRRSSQITIPLEAKPVANLSVDRPAAKGGTTDLTKFYPANNGFLGATERTFLMPGEQISRYGSTSGKFLSPEGTPLPMRALPPGSNTSIFNTYKVLKPFEVQAGKIAPAFGLPGLGTQYLSPVSVDVLLKRGIIGY